MKFDLDHVFDEYPNPLFIIKPIIINGETEDFEYKYVNKAFGLFLGLDKEELIGNNFKKFFDKGEKQWLDVFKNAATKGKHVFIDSISTVIDKKMQVEVFHIAPDMCGCIIYDYYSLFEDSNHKHKIHDAKKDVYYDFLTGCYDRFYLNEINKTICYKDNIGISFLDINNLKYINDTFGHQAGDDLIVTVSNIMINHYKNSMIFRIGGDEFVIITEGVSEDEFIKMSKEGKKLFEKDNLAAIGYRFYRKIDNLDYCIHQCDELMYSQKRFMKEST